MGDRPQPARCCWYCSGANSVSWWENEEQQFRAEEFVQLMIQTEIFSWEEQLTRDPKSGSLTMAGWISFSGSSTKFMIILALILNTTISSTRMILSPERILMYNSWYPFDVMASPTYELMFFLQGFAIFLDVCVLLGMSGMFVMLVSIVCSQLDKVITSLLEIKHNFSSPRRDWNYLINKSEVDAGPQENFEHFQKKLNDCIRLHQEVLSYIRLLERTLNPLMGGMFLLGLISMCLMSFSAVTSWGNHPEVVQAVAAYVFVAIALAVPCWFGYELTSQAELVRDAAFGCDWIGAPIGFQKCIGFIISRSNKEVALTAGKFVPVTISTMIAMINQSVSYFMVLLEVTKGIEETEDIEFNP